MLRLSKLFFTGTAAAALLASAPALAQNGLGSRLDAQEQQLAQAENSCGPVNLAEYANLLNEAMQNKARAEKLKKKGVPVDETQVNADLAKANMLFARAQAALARSCMMQAQQAAQPQPHVQTKTDMKSDYSNASVSGNSPVGNPADIFSLYQGPAGQGLVCDDYRCANPTGAQQANLSSFARDALTAQNAIRFKLGVPPLLWRPDLAQGAAARAQQMAASHELSHAPREGRGTIRENILKAPNSFSTTQMMNLWGNEMSDFVPGIFPNVCKSGGDCSSVYHVSQIGWATTLFVGCGEASDGAFTYVSCWYDKGGNKDGKEVGTQAAAAEGYKLWNDTHSTVSFRNGAATIKAKVTTTSGGSTTAITSTSSAPSVSLDNKDVVPPPKSDTNAATWRAGSISVTVLPVNFAPGPTPVAGAATTISLGPLNANQPNSSLSKAELDSLFLQYGPDANVGVLPPDYVMPEGMPGASAAPSDQCPAPAGGGTATGEITPPTIDLVPDLMPDLDPPPPYSNACVM